MAARRRGWMVLAVVAALFGLGVAITAVAAVFEGETGVVLTAVIWFCFWYWIAVGAYRRASSR